MIKKILQTPNKKDESEIRQIINPNIVKTKGRPRGRAKSCIEKNLKKRKSPNEEEYKSSSKKVKK